MTPDMSFPVAPPPSAEQQRINDLEYKNAKLEAEVAAMKTAPPAPAPTLPPAPSETPKESAAAATVKASPKQKNGAALVRRGIATALLCFAFLSTGCGALDKFTGVTPPENPTSPAPVETVEKTLGAVPVYGALAAGVLSLLSAGYVLVRKATKPEEPKA